MDRPLEPHHLGRLMAPGQPRTYRLGWYDNGDRLDLAVVVNRLVACGRAVSRLDENAAGAEAGDYLAALPDALAQALRSHGFKLIAWEAAEPAASRPVAPVGLAVLSGRASAYPYYGYYALTLARLGLSYRPVSGGDIAQGALDGENLLVLPGGFSNWSLDAKEETVGADEAVRAFFSDGGAAVVSCGGAFYLAKGRSNWLGLADARPRITQDYLRTGVGVTTCRIADGPLRLGLPPTLEIPYFHGPVFDEMGANCTALAQFRDLNASGGLFIDNPLTPETFAAHMQGQVAALRTDGPRGRAILFSPHPEMGDLLVKYMALEGYVPRYLPIRGALVMQETMDAYRPAESRSFLLVLNAVEAMAQGARPVAAHASAPERALAQSALAHLEAWIAAWQRRAGELEPSDGGLGDLERRLLSGFAARLPHAADALRRLLPMVVGARHDGPRLAASFSALAGDAVTAWAAPARRRPAELLLELELALLLVEAWRTVCEIHRLVEMHD
jgi:hypothetical protein